MNGIAVNIIVLFLKGIPEGLLIVLALHIFTRTKLDLEKYFLLSFIYIAATYLIRRLPITLGVHTVLTLLVLILIFQFTYNSQLSKVIRSVVSSAVILILVAVAEVFNLLLLIAIFGQTQAKELYTSKDGLTQSIYTIPSSVFLAVFVFAGYFILKNMDKRKLENGEAGKTTGE